MSLKVTEYMHAAINKVSDHDYDFKEIKKQLEWISRMQADQAARLLRAGDRRQSVASRSRSPGKGSFAQNAARQPGQGVSLADYENRPKPVVSPSSAWRKEAQEAAERLRRTCLPSSVSMCSPTIFASAITRSATSSSKGDIEIIRQGGLIRVPREAVAEYIAKNGVPLPRVAFYGSHGIRGR